MKKTLIVCTNTKPTDLTELISLSSNKAKDSKDWQEIAKVGRWKGHRAGDFSLSIDTFKEIIKNFKDSDSKDIVCDYEHQTLSGEIAVASGWCTDLKIEGNSFYAKVDWLPEAKEQIKAKKYKYLSPVLDPQTIDQTTGTNIGWSLHSIALTNKPFFAELKEVKINKDSNHKKEKKTMDEKAYQKLQDDLKVALEKIKTLEDEIAKSKEKEVDAKLATAVAAKKIDPTQVESLKAFGLSDPEALSKLLEASKAPTHPFENDTELLAASQQKGGGDGEINVLALGGIIDEN